LKKFGKYEVLGELGHGAMGVVYRARDPLINRLVALKTITTGLAGDPSLLQRFYREAQSAGGLEHPNIVTIYEMGDEQDLPYIAMQLIEGESLEEMISHRENLSITLKLSYALQACRAFDYAHKRGIIHRDIKPGNVMVNKESVVKVVDFGIARVLDTSKTRTGILIGTFAYMSPEQYFGERADERSDIWSFGVLLYELLGYRRPFIGENPASLMRCICSQDPPALRSLTPDCPPELEVVISKALRKSPRDRCQSMEDLLLELEAVYRELQNRSSIDLNNRSRQCVDSGDFIQARELLREALKVDSTNSQARSLMEKVNAELKRASVRPRVQQHVDRGRSLLQEGKIQEARVQVENALQLDNDFEPAQELQKQVQHEIERAERVADWLQEARRQLVEGLLDEADALLANVLEAEPANQQAATLQQQVSKERAERQRRAQVMERMQEARGLWTRQNYDACISLLCRLQEEFPDEVEIQRLLDTVREDQIEQSKQKTLERIRNLLAAGNYAECKSLLAGLQIQVPNDEQISRLIEDVRLDEAKQRRLQGFAEARNLLAARRYEECLKVLADLGKEFPDDDEIPRLITTAQEDQAEEQRQRGITEARNLLAARRYEDCSALLGQMQKQFGNDEEITRLLAAVQMGRVEQRKLARTAKARNLLAARRYEECLKLLAELGKEFADDEDVLKLLTTAREEQAEERKLNSVKEARSLIAIGRYEESVSLLSKLRDEFPKEPEINRLLANAIKEQAEQHKQQKLAEARALLAGQCFAEALKLLDGLLAAYSNDSAVQKLRTLAEREQEKQVRFERLQHELQTLKKQVSEKKYSDILSRAEALQVEFSGDVDVTRLVEFARAQQAQIESETRLRTIIDEVKSLGRASRFAEAILAADAGLAIFPEDTELACLRELAESEEKKQRARTLIEQRIREIKFKINRKDFSDAIELAKATLASTGPDEEVTQLLNCALVEHQAREKKRAQEQRFQEIRALIESRQVDQAEDTLKTLIASGALDSYDPRVERLSQAIDAAKTTLADLPKVEAPSASVTPNLSKEYAFLQSGPPQIEQPPAEKVAPTATNEVRRQSSEPMASPLPIAPPPPPLAPPTRPSEYAVAGVAPAFRPRVLSQLRFLLKLTLIDAILSTAPRTFKKASKIGVLSLGLISVALGTYVLVNRRTTRAPALYVKEQPVQPQTSLPVMPVQVQPPTPLTAQRNAAEEQLRAAEEQQRNAINDSDKRVASGDLNGALRALNGADKVNGPLTAEIRRKQASVAESMKNEALAKVRQQEAILWQQATSEMDRAQFDAAKSDLQKIVALKGGTRRADAQNYLDSVILQRQREEELFARAVQNSQSDNAQTEKRAVDLFGQVMGMNGPRKDEATARQNSLQTKLNNLMAALDVSGRQAIKERNFSAARLNAEQIREAGGDPAALSSAIEQAEQAEKKFQQTLQAYNAVTPSDRAGLEKSRSDFQAIEQEKGPRADDATTYVAEINRKIDLLNRAVQPPPPPAPPDKDLVQRVVQMFIQAFEQRNLAAMKQLWPSMPANEYAGYKTSFDMAKGISLHVLSENLNINPGSTAAAVSVRIEQKFTSRTGATRNRADVWTFELAKNNGSWVIINFSSKTR
jgi:serine/threonine protein kinase